MNTINYRTVWETYVQAWKTPSEKERKSLFIQVLAEDNTYTDPQVEVSGHDALSDYMAQFHEQFPGCYFETTYFLAHHDKSISRWNLKNDVGEVLSEGISFATYNEQGRLLSETGFYDTPESE